MASSSEVVITPPCQHKIAVARLPLTWMSSDFTCTPLSPPALKKIADSPPLSAPPWLGRGVSSSSKHLPHQRRAKYRLSKKASPDPPLTPNHHLDGLAEYFTGDRRRCGRAPKHIASTRRGKRPYWRCWSSIPSHATTPSTGGGQRGRRRRKCTRLG
jgi:hypothetical protein